MRVTPASLLLLLLAATPAQAIESYSYLNPDNHRVASEWALGWGGMSDGFQSLSFEIGYTPPRWYPRVRAGLSVDAKWVPGLLAGIELPLVELDSENSNSRSWGLYLRATQQIDARLGTETSVGVGTSLSWAGFAGPGLSLSYTLDKRFLFAVTMTGAVGLR